jgi:hypothetical protein
MSPRSPLEDVPGKEGMKAMPAEAPLDGRLLCFITPDRVCGPDCMAYVTNKPSQSDYKDQAWPHCLVLLNLHRTGKHLVILAETASKLLQKHPDPHTQIAPPDVR